MENKENININIIHLGLKRPRDHPMFKSEDAASILTHDLLELYRETERQTSLLFGVDKDIESLPLKRSR